MLVLYILSILLISVYFFSIVLSTLSSRASDIESIALLDVARLKAALEPSHPLL
jgi:hypothetical protein